MRLACSFALSTSLLFSNVADLPQAPQQSKDQQPAPKTEAAPLKQPLAFGLEDGTPIKLRLTRNLSSADATTGDRVDFEVLEDVKVKDVIVVPPQDSDSALAENGRTFSPAHSISPSPNLCDDAHDCPLNCPEHSLEPPFDSGLFAGLRLSSLGHRRQANSR